MLAPMFVTAAEILTFADLAVLKFYYFEPEVSRPEGYKPMDRGVPKGFPSATVIMPRPALKEITKKMMGFMANQDEHARYAICRNCEHCGNEGCPISPDAKFNTEVDGCSKFKLREETNENAL